PGRPSRCHAASNENVRWQAGQLDRESGQALITAFREAILDDDVSVRVPAQLAQTALKSLLETSRRGAVSRTWRDHADLSNLPGLLGRYAERHKPEADSENDREPDPPQLTPPWDGWAGVQQTMADRGSTAALSIVVGAPADHRDGGVIRLHPEHSKN